LANAFFLPSSIAIASRSTTVVSPVR
jgi:hypothetical protein